MSYETLRFTRQEAGDHGFLGIITLDRPQVRNAIDAAMVREMHQVLDATNEMPDLRALVLESSSEKAFAAGADISELKDRGVQDALNRINAGLFRRLEEHRLPSVAAVRGYALGGGCELAMCCDLRVAGAGAVFGQPEVGLGILPGAGAIQRLPKLIGLGRAKELILTGRRIDAQEALAIGLVNKVVADEAVGEAAREMAAGIAQQGPLAVQLSKMALNAAGRSDPSFETVDVLAQAVAFQSEDKVERMTRFLERKAKKKS